MATMMPDPDGPATALNRWMVSTNPASTIPLLALTAAYIPLGTGRRLEGVGRRQTAPARRSTLLPLGHIDDTVTDGHHSGDISGNG